MRIIMNLSQSIQFIIKNALRHFGDDADLVVLALVNDPLLNDILLPDDTLVIYVDQHGALAEPFDIRSDDVFILNGGSDPQLWAMNELSDLGTRCRVIELPLEAVSH